MAGHAQKVRLPDHERHILESRGVIPTPVVPKIDVITEQVKARKWELKITLSDQGHAVATVVAEGELHSAESEHEGLAVVKAFCAALVATEPAQGNLPLFGDEDEDEGADDDEGVVDDDFFDLETERIASGGGDDVPDNADGDEADEPDPLSLIVDLSEEGDQLRRSFLERFRKDAPTPEWLRERQQELRRRLNSPSLRLNHKEDYVAELLAVEEQLERVTRAVDILPKSDERERRERLAKALNENGFQVDLEDDDTFTDRETGTQVDLAYLEAEYGKVAS
jgi:hypothetical protein